MRGGGRRGDNVIAAPTLLTIPRTARRAIKRPLAVNYLGYKVKGKRAKKAPFANIQRRVDLPDKFVFPTSFEDNSSHYHRMNMLELTATLILPLLLIVISTEEVIEKVWRGVVLPLAQELGLAADMLGRGGTELGAA